jgi:hypothetical protein
MSSNAARVSKPRRSRQSKVTPIAEHRARRAASRTGKQEAEIERLPFDLSALEEEGVFVNVDAGGFGMLDRRIDWQALGIRLPQESDVAFHPPRCGVLPNRFRRPLLTPAAQAHHALHKYSYQFRLTETLFETPAYRWIPWRAFSEFESAFERAVGNLNEAKRAALDNYDRIRAEVLETFSALAEDSAQRLLATGTVVESGFRERVINGVLDALPREEELRDKLTLRYQVGVILLGSEMLREQRRAVVERHRIERAEAIRERERGEERAAATVVQQQLWVEQESARLRLVAEREELAREQAVKERIRGLKLDAAREKLQETLSPLQEGAAQLRATVYESAVRMHEALSEKEFLPGATARKARNMARWFRLMNFQSDDELERLVAGLERLAAKPDSRRKRMAESASVKAVLDDIIELTYRDAQTLTQPSRMTALEL